MVGTLDVPARTFPHQKVIPLRKAIIALSPAARAYTDFVPLSPDFPPMCWCVIVSPDFLPVGFCFSFPQISLLWTVPTARGRQCRMSRKGQEDSEWGVKNKNTHNTQINLNKQKFSEPYVYLKPLEQTLYSTHQETSSPYRPWGENLGSDNFGCCGGFQENSERKLNDPKTKQN